jgi:hypothetical protein
MMGSATVFPKDYFPGFALAARPEWSSLANRQTSAKIAGDDHGMDHGEMKIAFPRTWAPLKASLSKLSRTTPFAPNFPASSFNFANASSLAF